MSVTSQQINRAAMAQGAPISSGALTPVRGFAGNHTLMRKKRETNDEFSPQAHEIAQQQELGKTNGQFLQRKCACGGYGSDCKACEEPEAGTLQGAVQTKLAVSAPGDRYEQEADRVADQVLAAPTYRPVSDAPPRIQRFVGQSSGRASAAPGSVDHVLSSPGRPLGRALQQNMEQRFGHDFSAVRVHSGASAELSARQVNANAYTVGSDIVFGAGRFSPGTSEGRRLIAHELTHVVQQSGSNALHPGPTHEAGGRSTIPSSTPIRIARDPTGQTPEAAIAKEVHPDSVAFVENKMRQFYELLPNRERRRLKRNLTIAIGLATVDGQPRLVYTVANNKTSKHIRAAAKKLDLHRWTYYSGVKGRGAVGAPNDAEQLMAGFAADENARLRFVAVSRRVCPDCGELIVTNEGGPIPVSVVEDPIELPKKGRRFAPLKPPGEITAVLPPQKTAPKLTLEPIVTPDLPDDFVRRVAESENLKIKKQGRYATINGMTFAVISVGSAILLIDSIRANGIINTAKDLAVNAGLTSLIAKVGKVGIGVASMATMMLLERSDNAAMNESMAKSEAMRELIYQAFPHSFSWESDCYWLATWHCAPHHVTPEDFQRYQDTVKAIEPLIANAFELEPDPDKQTERSESRGLKFNVPEFP